MKKPKLNFNHKSYKEWVTLLMALMSAVFGILKVCGIEVSPDQSKDVTMVIMSILNVAAAAGIIYGPMDKQDKEDDKHDNHSN